MSQYNLKNPAVKRLMKEAEELRHPTDEYYAQPLEDNLFEWHFTIRGPPNTEFEGGIFHGRITLPPDYPMKPPSIILLTPNGRFEINKKICLSISGHHPESWQPSWSIRTALLAMIGFLPTHGNGAIGSLDYSPEERKLLALKSQDWKCPECGVIKGFLKEPDSESSKESVEAQETEEKPENEESCSSNLSVRCHEEIRNLAEAEEIRLTNLYQHPEPIFSSLSTETLHNPIIGQAPRQRHPFSQRDYMPQIESIEMTPIEINNVRNVHNYCSLFLIWVISLILVYLIVRRWLYHDFTL